MFILKVVNSFFQEKKFDVIKTNSHVIGYNERKLITIQNNITNDDST